MEDTSRDDFESWKQDPITIALFKILTKKKEEINQSLVASSSIFDEKYQLYCCTSAGRREVIDWILNIDLIEREPEQK